MPDPTLHTLTEPMTHSHDSWRTKAPLPLLLPLSASSSSTSTNSPSRSSTNGGCDFQSQSQSQANCDVGVGVGGPYTHTVDPPFHRLSLSSPPKSLNELVTAEMTSTSTDSPSSSWTSSPGPISSPLTPTTVGTPTSTSTSISTAAAAAATMTTAAYLDLLAAASASSSVTSSSSTITPPYHQRQIVQPQPVRPVAIRVGAGSGAGAVTAQDLEQSQSRPMEDIITNSACCSGSSCTSSGTSPHTSSPCPQSGGISVSLTRKRGSHHDISSPLPKRIRRHEQDVPTPSSSVSASSSLYNPSSRARPQHVVTASPRLIAAEVTQQQVMSPLAVGTNTSHPLAKWGTTHRGSISGTCGHNTSGQMTPSNNSNSPVLTPTSPSPVLSPAQQSPACDSIADTPSPQARPDSASHTGNHTHSRSHSDSHSHSNSHSHSHSHSLLKSHSLSQSRSQSQSKLPSHSRPSSPSPSIPAFASPSTSSTSLSPIISCRRMLLFDPCSSSRVSTVTELSQSGVFVDVAHTWTMAQHLWQQHHYRVILLDVDAHVQHTQWMNDKNEGSSSDSDSDSPHANTRDLLRQHDPIIRLVDTIHSCDQERNTAIIGITQHVTHTVMTRCQQLGLDGCVEKGMEMGRHLMDTINKTWAQRGQGNSVNLPVITSRRPSLTNLSVPVPQSSFF